MNNIHEQAILKFGRDNQMLKCIEEMSELTQVLAKYINMSLSLTQAELRQLDYDICEEIADVQIVLDQMKLLFPDWKEHKKRKIDRLEDIVNDKKNSKKN